MIRKNSGRIFLAFLLFALGLAATAPSPVLAEANWEDEKDVWKDISKQRQYKDPGYAAKLSLTLLPIDNGHFYVGEVGKGIWFTMGETASLAALAVPFLRAQNRSRENVKPLWTDAMVVSAALGGVGYLLLKIWSAFDAAEGARRFNRRREAEKQKKEGSLRFDWRRRGFFLTRRWG